VKADGRPAGKAVVNHGPEQASSASLLGLESEGCCSNVLYRLLLLLLQLVLIRGRGLMFVDG